MIDEARCRAVLASCLPDLATGPVRFLAAGMDSAVFLIGADLLVRFPRRAAAARRLEQEARLLPALAPLLSIPIPRFLHVVRDCAAHPLTFAVYRRVPGMPADRASLDDVRRTALAAAVGRLLRALHAFPPALAAALDIGPAGGALDAGRFRDLTAWTRRRVAPLLEPVERRRLATWFASAEDEGLLDFSPALVHADLGAPHLLVDRASGDLVGVIDFGDAGIGDPALDFAGLLTFLGPLGVRTALASYGRPDDGALLRRARMHAQIFPLHDIRFGLESGEEAHVRAGLAGLRARMLQGDPGG